MLRTWLSKLLHAPTGTAMVKGEVKQFRPWNGLYNQDKIRYDDKSRLQFNK